MNDSVLMVLYVVVFVTFLGLIAGLIRSSKSKEEHKHS